MITVSPRPTVGCSRLLLRLTVVLAVYLAGVPSHAQTRLTEKLPVDPEAGARLGVSVAIHRDTAIAGAYFAAERSGAAHLWERRAGEWSHVLRLAAPTAVGITADGAQFGFEVALHGDVAAVGAPFATTDQGPTGAVFLVERVADQWLPLALDALDALAPGAAAGAELGSSVAVETGVQVGGERLDILAAGARGDAERRGSVFLFERSDSAWIPVATLGGTDSVAGDEFGTAVALSATTLAVGAPFHRHEGIPSGAVYVFQRQAGGAWTQVREVTPPVPRAWDAFGYSLDLDGPTLVVGSPLCDDAGLDAGEAYVFTSGATPDPTPLGSTSPATARAPGDQFGVSVSLDGDRLLVGARRADRENRDAGAAFLFEREPGAAESPWRLRTVLGAADARPGDELGFQGAVDGATLLLGAFLEDEESPEDSRTLRDSGGVYALDLQKAQVRFTSPRTRVQEGERTVELRLQLLTDDGRPTRSAVTVQISAADDGATRDLDYALETPSVTFPVGFAGGNAETVTVRILDDDIDEDDEAVTLTLETGSGAGVGSDSTHRLLLEDDDDEAGVELDPGLGADRLVTSEEGGSATFSVVLTSEPTAPVTVDFLLEATDEGTVSSPLPTFTPEDWDVPQLINLTGLDDGVDDCDVVYTLTASPSSEDPKYNVPEDDPDEIVVVNKAREGGPCDFSRVKVGFVTAETYRFESQETISLPVGLETAGEFFASASAVRVVVEVSPQSTATEGVDFELGSRVLVFEGTTLETLEVAIQDDLVLEGDEVIVLRLADASGASVGEADEHRVTLVDRIELLTDEKAWQDLSPDRESLTMVKPRVRAAEELGGEPKNGEPLGDKLTFDPADTGLSRRFRLRALEEDANFVFGERVAERRQASYNNSLSVGEFGRHQNDDFEVEILAGPELTSFALVVTDSRPEAGETIQVYGPGRDDLIASFAVELDAEGNARLGPAPLVSTDDKAGKNGQTFLGVVSVTPIARVVFDEAATGGDDIALRQLSFATYTPPAAP